MVGPVPGCIFVGVIAIQIINHSLPMFYIRTLMCIYIIKQKCQIHMGLQG